MINLPTAIQNLKLASINVGMTLSRALEVELEDAIIAGARQVCKVVFVFGKSASRSTRWQTRTQRQSRKTPKSRKVGDPLANKPGKNDAEKRREWQPNPTMQKKERTDVGHALQTQKAPTPKRPTMEEASPYPFYKKKWMCAWFGFHLASFRCLPAIRRVLGIDVALSPLFVCLARTLLDIVWLQVSSLASVVWWARAAGDVHWRREVFRLVFAKWQISSLPITSIMWSGTN